MRLRERVYPVLTVLLIIAFTLLALPAAADEPPGQGAAQQAAAAPAPPPGPKPDPAGIATGDKSNALDAAGNPFVVSEPTDKKAADYANKKKEYDEYQAQAEKEPLAVKLADTVGHVRIATNFSWTLLTGLPGSLHASGLCPAHLRAGAQEERRPPDDA